LAESGRDLLAQRYDENLSIQQISSALDKTANTVRLKLHRLRIKLMNCVERRVKKELA
jgi:DNA-directed RNA polymerase specialized sigma24 family protein